MTRPQYVIELKSDEGHHDCAMGHKYVRTHTRIVAPNLSIDPETAGRRSRLIPAGGRLRQAQHTYTCHGLDLRNQ
jgi:hypothetical protein